jgi:phosphopantothenoylcysteine decarboxylase/phosphopantothenate--cysteine ligase
MGYAIARAAIEAGARVTLISGPTAIEPPQEAHVEHIETGRQMLDAVTQACRRSGHLHCSAAVADYYVANRSTHKSRKKAECLHWNLS